MSDILHSSLVLSSKAGSGGGSSDNQDLLGVSFDGTNAAGTRTYGAADLSFTKSTDQAAGTDPFRENPIYQGYYVLVKYNSTTQKAEIVAYEGTKKYDDMITANEEDFDVVRMFPLFYFKHIIDNQGKIQIVLSKTAKAGFKPSPMHYRNGVLHEWIGITRYAWGNAGSGAIAARAGLYPLTNTTRDSFETKARARGMRVFGIKEASALQILGCVKYANLNWQSAIGAGFSGAPTSDRTITIAQENANSVIVSNSYTANFPVGASIYLASNDFRTITGNTAYDEDNIEVSFGGAPFTSTTSTKVHGGLAINGSADNVKGLDGENTAMHASANRRSVIILGIENLFGNCWKFLTDTMRMNGTSASYFNPNPDGDSTYPEESNLRGWQQGPIILTTSGYIKRFAPTYSLGDLTHLSIPAELGGNENNPVGDYQYSNDATERKCCLFGGTLGGGAFGGPFCLSWSYGLGVAGWFDGALGVFVPDL
ncbi:MAG: hypothetical protein II972_01600 [Elusimicrobiaceae bacterium]|nr:hypothetical protein [Elusimicrobiaceae bacterium]